MMDALRSSRAASQGRRNAAWAVAAAAALALPLATAGTIYLHTAVVVVITAIAAIGFMLIYQVGQLSMSHAAFVGLGAYASAYLSTRLAVPFLLSMALSIAGVALCAALLGWLILRIRGVYFVLITFAFGQVLGLMFLDLESITGGAVGFSGIPAPAFFGYKVQTAFAYYYLALFFCVLAMAFAIRVLASDTGRAFNAISNNLRLAEASGIPTLRYQILAFTIGSALAGASGTLAAHYTRFVTPGSYELSFIVSLIVMVVLGGRNSVAGAVAGAAFLVPLSELLRDTRELQNIIYGLVVLFTLWFLPEGLTGLPARVGRIAGMLRARPGSVKLRNRQA